MKHLLNPADIGLILSYQCQSRCLHCVYNCSSEWQDWITPEDIEAAFDQLLLLPGQFRVHLTGGEPFLNFPLLLHAVEAATQRGIACYCETNGGWAKSEAWAEARFRQLRQAGMAYVLISVSPFHLESIAPRKTFNAINAAIRVFGPERVFVYQTQWLDFIRQFGDDQPVKLERYADFYGDEVLGKLLWQQYGLIEMGRAPYRLGHWVQKLAAVTFRGQTCRLELLHADHSHLDLYGNFLPNFCGGISLGDWHDLKHLREQYAHQAAPTLVQILIKHGAYGLFEWAAGQYGYQENPAGYCGACHLCVDVRRHLLDQGNFPELTPAGFYRTLAAEADSA